MSENAGKVTVEKVDRPILAKHDSKLLDLAFAMDCTGSMGSYIESARSNIRRIVEEIVSSEKSDVRLALVEYRDHPPQEASFVTRTHDFTGSPNTMKGWLDNCAATGGGDAPEAVADALHDVFKLDWREDATKICVFISDAPPHGLSDSGDGFPNGCPSGIDPMDVTHKLAEKGVTIYMVGCEPSITPYKDFFMAVAFLTGGQYVPLTKASLLSKVIIGGAQEEMSLEQLTAEVDQEIQAEMAAGRSINEDDMAMRMQSKWASRGERTKQLRRNNAELETVGACPEAKKLTKCTSMSEVKSNFTPKNYPQTQQMLFSACAPPPPGAMSLCMSGSPAPPLLMGGPPPRGGAPLMRGAPMGGAPPMGGALSMSAPTEENYACVEDDISYAQSSRMVQKAMMRNKAWKK